MLSPMKMSIHTDYYSFLCVKKGLQVGFMRQALGPGALGRPRGSGWKGRWERGSGWGTHVK